MDAFSVYSGRAQPAHLSAKVEPAFSQSPAVSAPAGSPLNLRFRQCHWVSDSVKGRGRAPIAPKVYKKLVKNILKLNKTNVRLPMGLRP